MRKFIKIYQLFTFTLLFSLSSYSCSDTEIKNGETVDDLLSKISVQVADVKNHDLKARTPDFDPVNPENPFDVYGETYAIISTEYNPSDYIATHLDQDHETIKNEYLGSVRSFLALQGMTVDDNTVQTIEQQIADIDNYDFDHLLDKAYQDGKISSNTKALLDSYYSYNQDAGIDAATFNEISLIFENNIIESSVLNPEESTQTLGFVALVKYDNAINGKDTSLARGGRNCMKRALGALIIGFLTGGPGAGFTAAAIVSILCEFAGSN